MRVIIASDYAEMSRRAAELVASAVRAKPDLVLGLATGSTPLGLYDELVRLENEGELDLSQVTTFNLDEYLGIPENHPQSYHRFMEEHFFGRLRERPRATHIPPASPEDPLVAAEAYERAIHAAGGIDVQILGIGRNGHIGFNEPGSSLASRTRPVVLRAETIRDNARFFDSIEDVPRYALTMGIGTILEARRIILLASGTNKADAVARAIEGPVCSSCPASALQLHPDPVFVLDAEAAAYLRQADYYRHVDRLMCELEQADGRQLKPSAQFAQPTSTSGHVNEH